MRVNLNLCIKSINLIILVLLGCNTLVFSQSKIKGTVKLLDESVVEYASILFVDNQGEIIGHEVSDKNGEFILNIDTSLSFFEISYLGYESIRVFIDSISISGNNTYYLNSIKTELPEIQILGEKIDKVINKDTITYSLNYYKSSTDYNLGDVLNRLDGVSISNDGTISYQQKVIDKILIEGKDIINNQHKLTIESLAPKDIAKIQIIEQYRPFNEQFSKKFSNKVAMNILLSQEAKLKVSGDMSTQAGIKNKYESKINLYSANSKSGKSGFFRSNNLGNPSITTNDFLNLQSSIIRTLNKTNGKINELIPSALMDDDGQQKDWDNLIALNYEKAIDKINKIKISNLSNYTDKKVDIDIKRQYFQNPTPLIGQQSSQEQLIYSKTVLNVKSMLNNGSLLELDFPLHFEKQTISELFSDIESSNFPKSEMRSDLISHSLFPQIYYSIPINNNVSLKFESSLLFDSKNSEINIRSEENIFGSDTTFIQQRLNQNRIDYSLKSELVYKKDMLRLGATLPVNYSKHRIDNYANENIITESVNTSNLIYTSPEIWMGYKTDRIWIEPKVEFNYLNASSTNFSTTNLFVNPSLQVRYNFSRINYLLLQFYLKKSLYDLENYYDLNEIINTNRLRIYGIDTEKDSQASKSLTLSYLNINLNNKSRWQSVFTYSKTKNELYDINQLQGNFFLQSRNVAENISHISWMINGEKRLLSGVLLLRPFLLIDHNNIKIETPIRLNSIKSKLGIFTNSPKYINGNLNISYNIFSQIFGNIGNKFQVINIEQGLDFKWGRTVMHINGNYNIRIGQFLNNFYVAGFNIEYKLNQKLNIKILGRDIFNLNSRDIQNFETTTTYIQTSSFQRFPGSIIAGIKMIW